MSRKRFPIPLALAASLASLCAAVPTTRPAQPPQNMPFTVEGKIIKAEPGKLTLGTGENIVFYVRYDDQTKITRADGTPGESEDLRAGVHINVKGDLNENGDVIAKTIQIEGAEKSTGQNP